MKRIIEQLKEQREKAEKTFVKNCLIKRASPVNSPIPDTESYLEEVYELNQAISILESNGYITIDKKFVDNKPKTTYFITELGRRDFSAYVSMLDEILKSMK